MIDPNDISNLIADQIETQDQLNAAEEINIALAHEWTLTQSKEHIISIDFIRLLHWRMFNLTWKWAGQFRKSECNIGVPWQKINISVKQLCDNVNYQIENKLFTEDEIAIQFHCKLVWIHPFVNGNGRHARLIANLLIERLGKSPFTWGQRQNLSKDSAIRKQYIETLKAADSGDYKPLLEFARS